MRAGSRGFSCSFAAAGVRRTLFTLALFSAVGGRPVLAGGAVARFLSPVDSFLAKATNDAIATAEIQLANPRCEQVFSDFRNPSGVPLRTALDALGVTGGLYLRRLRFVNGERLSFCSSGALAGTKPGSEVIFLCGLRFAAAQRANPRLGAAVVIHEELHSLGLSENPPSSQEITAGVLARCGS
jgi:hypothetical protein